MLKSKTNFGIIRIAGTSVNLYDTVEKNMIAMRACIHKAICDVNDQYPDLIVSVLSKIEVSMPSSQRPNRVDAHGVIIIKRTCNSLQLIEEQCAEIFRSHPRHRQVSFTFYLDFLRFQSQ